MPLINGQKMACEPCIRGHRSTKCTHANERLMVPVRKPGRPLSSCPHPASRPCNCGTVTAAIPRKQTCGCGTSSTSTPHSRAETEDPTSPATSPDEPSRPTITPTSSSFRVQKSRAAPSRKMSIDPASLDRMDSSQLNVLPATPSYSGSAPPTSLGLSNGHIPAVPNISHHFPVMGIHTPEHAFSPQPIMFPMFHPHMPSPMMSTATAPPTPSVKNSPRPAAGSCCGGGAAEKRASVDTLTAETSPKPRVNGDKPKVSSCCSSKPPVSENHVPSSTIGSPDTFPSPNDVMMAPFQQQLALANGMYGLFPQPTVFTYPPQYGTFMQPLQPEQWRQMMASIAFGQMAQQSQGFDLGATMAAASSYAHVANTPANPPASSAGTSHHCTCGDGCQCVGCAAHPYNEATQNYVRSAWSSMNEEANGASAHTNGNHSLNNGSNGHNHTHSHHHGLEHHHHHHHQRHASLSRTHVSSNGNGSENGHIVDSISTTDPALGDANGGGHSTTTQEGPSTGPQTPSDAPSSITEEQALSASDFFFVTYPFGDSCAGDTSSCPCGDDCQCIGCVIHNNPEPS